MSNSSVPRGPGLFEIGSANGPRLITNVRWLAGAERPPGSALIAWAAWLLAALGAGLLFVSFAGQFRYIFLARHQNAASLIEALMFDVGMIIFSLLALGLARVGKPARTERALILACSAGSAAMNYAAADTASPRSVVAYVAAPVFLAVVVDRVVAVIRRHVLGDGEVSAWAAPGRAVVAVVRLAGLILLYSLRFALAAPETARGLRRIVLDAAPLPGPPANYVTATVPVSADQTVEVSEVPADVIPAPAIPPVQPSAPRAERAPKGETKKAHLLRLYAGHPGRGDRSKVSRIATELAPQASLDPRTARTYLYAEVDGTRR